jgi:hypothetical protein
MLPNALMLGAAIMPRPLNEPWLVTAAKPRVPGITDLNVCVVTLELPGPLFKSGTENDEKSPTPESDETLSLAVTDADFAVVTVAPPVGLTTGSETTAMACLLPVLDLSMVSPFVKDCVFASRVVSPMPTTIRANRPHKASSSSARLGTEFAAPAVKRSSAPFSSSIGWVFTKLTLLSKAPPATIETKITRISYLPLQADTIKSYSS